LTIIVVEFDVHYTYWCFFK